MDLKMIHDIGETVGGFSAPFAVLAVIVAFLAHRKTSRDKAIEILLEWTRHFATIDCLLLNLAYQLEDNGSDEQIKALASKQSFMLKTFQEKIFQQGIERYINKVPEQGTTALRVEFGGVVQIRAVVVSYLNMIECALAAARHTSANTKIIHKEFEGFYDPDTGKAVFQRFRKIPESGSYPSIALFEAKLREEYGCRSDPAYMTERIRRRLTSTLAPIDREDLEKLAASLEQRIAEFKKWSDVDASISVLTQTGFTLNSADYQRRWASKVPIMDIQIPPFSGLTDSKAIEILRRRFDERESVSILPETLRRVLVGDRQIDVLCDERWVDSDSLTKALLEIDFQDVVYLLREIWVRTEMPSPSVDLGPFRRSLATALDKLDSERPSCKTRTSYVRTGRWEPSAGNGQSLDSGASSVQSLDRVSVI